MPNGTYGGVRGRKTKIGGNSLFMFSSYSIFFCAACRRWAVARGLAVAPAAVLTTAPPAAVAPATELPAATPADAEHTAVLTTVASAAVLTAALGCGVYCSIRW